MRFKYTVTCVTIIFSASEVLDNHSSVLVSFGVQTNEEFDFPYIYWIVKMHKNPFKHQFNADLSEVFDQTFIHSIHKISYTY